MPVLLDLLEVMKDLTSGEWIQPYRNCYYFGFFKAGEEALLWRQFCGPREQAQRTVCATLPLPPRSASLLSSPRVRNHLPSECAVWRVLEKGSWVHPKWQLQIMRVRNKYL